MCESERKKARERASERWGLEEMRARQKQTQAQTHKTQTQTQGSARSTATARGKPSPAPIQSKRTYWVVWMQRIHLSSCGVGLAMLRGHIRARPHPTESHSARAIHASRSRAQNNHCTRHRTLLKSFTVVVALVPDRARSLGVVTRSRRCPPQPNPGSPNNNTTTFSVFAPMTSACTWTSPRPRQTRTAASTGAQDWRPAVQSSL